jgi:multimeric flavodoxin WrbA
VTVPSKKKLLIIYHSQGGNTEKLAEACFEGILRQNEVEVFFKRALGTTLRDVLNCDALLIVTPEYFGTMSGAVKDFFDRTYYPAREKNVNLPYALLVCCENEGQGTQRDIEKIASGYVLRKALDPLIIRDNEIETRRHEAVEFGQTFAAGLAMGIF